MEFLLNLFDGNFIAMLLQSLPGLATDTAAVVAEVADPDAIRVFGMDLIDVPDFNKLLFRFAINITMIIVIVRFVYYPVARRKDYLFTYFLISITVFFLCFLLENVKLELGFALGLFAIFGIIRYRTDPIPIKEMTYLFIIIGLSVINALANKKISYAELFLTNLAVVGVAYSLEHVFLLKHETRKTIVYEKIELIKPEMHAELMADLCDRTGLKINRIEIGKIDFLRDTANVRIFYYQDEQGNHFEESGYNTDSEMDK
jgi:hypothetical protein